MMNDLAFSLDMFVIVFTIAYLGSLLFDVAADSDIFKAFGSSVEKRSLLHQEVKHRSLMVKG